MSNDKLSPADRALIEGHIKRNGVTKCPRGASGEIPSYIWKPSQNGEGGKLIVDDADRLTGPQQLKKKSRAAMAEHRRKERVMAANARARGGDA